MRYIDADKLIEHLEDNLRECGNPDLYTKPITYGCVIGLKGALSYAETLPTADVVEVRHAEWIEDGYEDSPCVCSYCGAEAHYTSTFSETFDYDYDENLQSTGYEETRGYIQSPYCPHCGAKMDGERKGGEEDA